jgi:hypothetical protein
VESGIGIMVAAIVFGLIAIPVASSVMVTELDKVNNETISSSGSTPDVYTLGTVQDGISQDSETIYLEDSLDSQTYELQDGDYTLDYESGEVNVTVADLDNDGNDEINSTNDQYLATYEYKPDGYLGGITGTVADYIPLALALVLFVASIGLVRSG